MDLQGEVAAILPIDGGRVHDQVPSLLVIFELLKNHLGGAASRQDIRNSGSHSNPHLVVKEWVLVEGEGVARPLQPVQIDVLRDPTRRATSPSGSTSTPP